MEIQEYQVLKIALWKSLKLTDFIKLFGYVCRPIPWMIWISFLLQSPQGLPLRLHTKFFKIGFWGFLKIPSKKPTIFVVISLKIRIGSFEDFSWRFPKLISPSKPLSNSIKVPKKLQNLIQFRLQQSLVSKFSGLAQIVTRRSPEWLIGFARTDAWGHSDFSSLT